MLSSDEYVELIIDPQFHQELEIDQVEILQEFHSCHQIQFAPLFKIYIPFIQTKLDSVHEDVLDHQPPHPPPGVDFVVTE